MWFCTDPYSILIKSTAQHLFWPRAKGSSDSPVVWLWILVVDSGCTSSWLCHDLPKWNVLLLLLPCSSFSAPLQCPAMWPHFFRISSGKLPLKLNSKWALGLLKPENVHMKNSAKQVLTRKVEIQLFTHRCLAPFEEPKYGLWKRRHLHMSPSIPANPT